MSGLILAIRKTTVLGTRPFDVGKCGRLYAENIKPSTSGLYTMFTSSGNRYAISVQDVKVFIHKGRGI